MDKRVSADRKAGLVYVDYQLAAKIVVQDTHTFHAEFRQGTMDALNINKDEVKAKFDESSRAVGGQWCL